jgi:cytochrome c6
MGSSLIKFAFLLLAIVALSVSATRADNTAQKTFQAKCAGCHGADGKGQTGAGKALKVGDFSSPEVRKLSDAELNKIITDGKGKMPAYGKTLSGSEITDLVEYVRGLGKK